METCTLGLEDIHTGKYEYTNVHVKGFSEKNHACLGEILEKKTNEMTEDRGLQFIARGKLSTPILATGGDPQHSVSEGGEEVGVFGRHVHARQLYHLG